jgi:hypothetical protein
MLKPCWIGNKVGYPLESQPMRRIFNYGMFNHLWYVFVFGVSHTWILLYFSSSTPPFLSLFLSLSQLPQNKPNYRLSGYRFRDSQFYIKEEIGSYLYTFLPVNVINMIDNLPSIPPEWQMSCYFAIHLTDKQQETVESYSENHDDIDILLHHLENIPSSILFPGWDVRANYYPNYVPSSCTSSSSNRRKVFVILSGERTLVTRSQAMQVQQQILQHLRDFCPIPFVERHTYWTMSNPCPANLLLHEFPPPGGQRWRGGQKPIYTNTTLSQHQHRSNEIAYNTKKFRNESISIKSCDSVREIATTTII